MMQISNPRFLSFLCFLLFLPALAFPFQQEETVSGDSTLARKPQPIPVVRIIPEMEEVREEIQLNYGRIEPGRLLRRIDSLYPPYKKFIRTQQDLAEGFLASNPNRDKIDNLIKKWNEYRTQLQGWESAINEYAERNLRLLDRIRWESEVWKLTEDNARQEAIPEELIANIGEVRKALGELEGQTVTNNNTYLRLESRINRVLQTVKGVTDSLYAKKEAETYDLLYHRHPPIWNTRFDIGPAGDRSMAQKESLPEIFSSFREQVRLEQDRLFLMLLISIFLSGFLYYIRKRVLQTRPEDAEIPKSSYAHLITRMPVATGAFLIGMLARIEFASSPRIVIDLLTLLLLILAIALIRYRIPRRFRGLIYFAVLFLVLDAVKTYVWFTSPNYRLYLFAEAFLFLGVLFFFTKPYRQTRDQMQTHIGKWMIRLVPVVYVLGGISILSNALGYTNLADMSLKVVTKSGVFAIVFYAILKVLESGSISWLKSRFARLNNPDPKEFEFLKDRIVKGLRGFVLLLFVLFFLNLIDELRDIQAFFSEILSEPYKVGNLTFTIGAILMFLLILFLSYVASRLIAFLIGDQYGLLRFFRLPKGVPTAISLVLRYGIIAFGIVLALSYLNVDLSKFNLMAGALGLGIGFGLQTVISNFVSGLILVFERPILPGDTIEVDNLFGKVSKIGVRASSITTYDGAEVVVPNMNLISNDLINWTLSDSIRRVEVLVGTSYGSDPNQVLEILKACASELDYVIPEREPLALFTEFGESSLNFRLLFWVPFEKGLSAKSDVSLAVYNKFKAAGIEIPFPQRDLHVKSMPETKEGRLREGPPQPRE